MISWPPVDDVVVGDDHPVGAHDDAGAERLGDALARHAHAAAEHLPEGIDRLAHHPAAVDVDHRRRGLAHHGREGQAHAGRVGRHDRAGLGQAAGRQALGARLAGGLGAGGQEAEGRQDQS